MTENDRQDCREYVSLQNLADLIGVHLSTVNRLRRRGVLPKDLFIHFGARLVRVDLKAFRAWLADFEGVIRDPAPTAVPKATPANEGHRGTEGDGGPPMKLLH